MSGASLYCGNVISNCSGTNGCSNSGMWRWWVWWRRAAKRTKKKAMQCCSTCLAEAMLAQTGLFLLNGGCGYVLILDISWRPEIMTWWSTRYNRYNMIQQFYSRHFGTHAGPSANVLCCACLFVPHFGLFLWFLSLSLYIYNYICMYIRFIICAMGTVIFTRP